MRTDCINSYQFKIQNLNWPVLKLFHHIHVFQIEFGSEIMFQIFKCFVHLGREAEGVLHRMTQLNEERRRHGNHQLGDKSLIKSNIARAADLSKQNFYGVPASFSTGSTAAPSFSSTKSSSSSSNCASYENISCRPNRGVVKSSFDRKFVENDLDTFQTSHCKFAKPSVVSLALEISFLAESDGTNPRKILLLPIPSRHSPRQSKFMVAMVVTSRSHWRRQKYLNFNN